MKINNFLRRFTSLMGALTIWSTAEADTPFIAEELIYDANTQIITARGLVEIDAEQGYFYLDELDYDLESGSITVRGNVKGQLPSGEKILSDFAFLDPDTKELILRNAHLMLQSKLQVVAQYVKEGDAATYAENVRVTSCEVCVINPVPIWQIDADQVYRDKTQSKIYFRNSSFSILGEPVVHLSNLRIPDADATRMSGILKPTLIISDLFDPGVRIPYFQVIDEQSDMLMSTYLTASGVANIEGRYRNYIKGGKLQLDGAYSLYDGEGETGRYYLQSKFTGNLTDKIKLRALYTTNSDNDFAPNFSYKNANADYLYLESTSNSEDFSLSVVDYRATTIAKETRNNPLVFPRLTYKTNQQLGLGTAFFADYDFLGLINEDDDEVIRLETSVGIEDVYALPFGISLNSQFGGRAQAYGIGEVNEEFWETATRVSPLMSLDATLPLAKSDANGSTLFIPRAQLTWSDNFETGADIPNSDALFIEHDYITLFSPNQYSGTDRLETGLRANIGASYIYNTVAGDDVDVGFGKTIRFTTDETLEDFSDTSIDDEEWVGYVNYTSPQDYSVYARGSWNNALELSRAEVGFELAKDDFSLSIDAVHLEPEPEFGYDEKRQEMTIDGFYHFAPNWQADFGLQYDFVNTYPLETSMALTYGNECIELSAGFLQDYSRGEGIDTETTYSLSVVFIGLGQTPTRNWPRRQCTSVSQLN